MSETPPKYSHLEVAVRHGVIISLLEPMRAAGPPEIGIVMEHLTEVLAYGLMKCNVTDDAMMQAANDSFLRETKEYLEDLPELLRYAKSQVEQYARRK